MLFDAEFERQWKLVQNHYIVGDAKTQKTPMGGVQYLMSI
jgi:hypothetical protein